MTFPFGKHRGKSVAEVASSDLGYLSWVLKESETWDRPLNENLRKAIQDTLSGTVATNPSVVTSGEPLVNFGKYRGSPLSVLLADRPYSTWCLQQDFFKRNPLFSKVAEVVGSSEVVSVYSTGTSGIQVPGDGGTVSFGKYKGQQLSTMLADGEYCKWVVKAARDWNKEPRDFDKIVEASRKVASRSSDDHCDDEEEEYEIDDTPLEDPDD